MGSSSKRQTTMAKLARERALQEKRELKQQKRDERRRAAAEAKAAREGATTSDASGVEGDVGATESSSAPSDEAGRVSSGDAG
jgi:hypothetical protein